MKTLQVDAWFVMGGTDLQDMTQVQKETDGQMRAVASGPGTVRSFWMHLKPPLDDPRVRRAIYLAIDREEIRSISYKGEGVTGNFFPPGFTQTEEDLLQLPGFRVDKTEDLVEAKQLLTEAGFPDGFELTFNVDQSKHSRTEATLITEQLKKALNIEVTMQVSDRAKMYQGLRDGSSNLSIVGSGLYFLEPQTVLAQFYAKDTLRNPENWEDPRMEELMQLEARELNQDIRRGHYIEMDEILSKGEGHWVPLFWLGRAGAVNYHIQNFRPPYHPHTIWRWDQIWWDPDAKNFGPDAPPIR